MSKLEIAYSGYVCAPYLHTHESVELKEIWINSDNIEKLFFVTGTFTKTCQSYFEDTANHYLLAKFKNSQKVATDLETVCQEKRTFVFNVRDDLFEREVKGDVNFVSMYYLEYGDDMMEIASLLLRREKVARAGIGNMVSFGIHTPKFTFPYAENIVVIEVASEKSYQSVKKYCDQTRREINRKGLTMTNMMSLSILDQMK